MFGVVLELVEDVGAGSEMGSGSGAGMETGTEVLHILVSSEEDTIDGTGQEVTESWTDANEGLGSDGGCKGNCRAELNQILAGGPKLIYYNK